MAYFTVTGLAAAFDKLTVNTAFAIPELPSSTLTFPIDTTGGATATSSLRIVTVAALAVPNVAPVAEVNVTVNVSSDSTAVSPATSTVNVAELVPLRIFTDPADTAV